MPKFLLPIISLIAFISLSLNLHLLWEKRPQSYEVAEVIDGDTFKINKDGGMRVRLMGVNAPESGKCLSTEAKNKLSELVAGQNVTLSDQFTDPFGRIMANVYVNGKYINKELLSLGLARMDYKEQPKREELKTAYAIAINEKAGLHGDICISTYSDKDCNIKGNIDTSKQYKTYLTPKCRNYSQVEIDLSTDDQWFCTEEGAKDAGFVKNHTCP